MSIRLFFALLTALAVLLALECSSDALDIYVVGGQSNAVGLGQTENEPAPRHQMRIFQLGEFGSFEYAHDPLACLAPSQKPLGVGPGLWFADRMVELSGETVGIVQCAQAGTHIYEWEPWYNGKALYWNLIWQAKRAARHGNISGLLWYQGEADASDYTDARLYRQRTINFFRHVRQSLNIPDLPIVYVQLGPDGEGMFSHEYWGWIQQIQKNMENDLPNLKMVSAKDLTTGTPYHLDQTSQIRLGHRLANAMYDLSFQ